MKEKNIIKAILKLAECIDNIESQWISEDTRKRSRFRTRKMLIEEILNEKTNS